jgi:predicted nucleic acid-binding protein
MARPALVLDASVGVKWFSPENEAALNQALAIRDAHISKQILVMVPDLFYYEVINAIVHKSFFSKDMINTAVSSLFALNLSMVSIDSKLLADTVSIARQFNITVYDSCYLAMAKNHNCPLVTANPRHQKQVSGCQVVPIEQWKEKRGHRL